VINPKERDLDAEPKRIPDRIGDWLHIGQCLAVWDEENRAQDRRDEKLDAMRVHNGMTLDEFLAKQ
jgi:hypothetical protein